MSNINEKKDQENLYIIISNSLQNDFLEQLQFDPSQFDPWKVGYEDCRDKWIPYFKENELPKGEKDITDFINELRKIENPHPNDLEISYHEYIKKLKHRVHIGIDQSKRLWTDNRLGKFIHDLMETARIANDPEIPENNHRYYFIHLRDWHDPSHQAEREELSNYGYHCIKGSHGAEFIKPLSDYVHKHPYDTFTQVINSNSLSSFTETKLDFILDSIIKNHDSSTEKAIIGVFGVVTDVKLKLLTFELKVVHNFKQVYLCEDLSAGFSQHGQDEGIDYMRYNLGVNILKEKPFREIFNIKQ
ncbi:MAG: cysteine hydrolase family protein [Promethearchaeota archaeon]